MQTQYEKRNDYVHTDGRVVSWWAKDQVWHITEFYYPTEADKKEFPASYPAGIGGPFYRWSEREFGTREDAIRELTRAVQS